MLSHFSPKSYLQVNGFLEASVVFNGRLAHSPRRSDGDLKKPSSRSRSRSNSGAGRGAGVGSPDGCEYTAVVQSQEEAMHVAVSIQTLVDCPFHEANTLADDA